MTTSSTRILIVVMGIAGVAMLLQLGHWIMKPSAQPRLTPRTEITFADASTTSVPATGGWYFMTPPIVKDGAKKPLAAWEINSAYASEADCQKFKRGLGEYAKGQFYESKAKQGDAFWVFGMAGLGQCVRASDPRLRAGR